MLLGSDGLWDNVFDEEINAVCESVVNSGLSGSALAAEIACSVAKYASTNAHDNASVSPFYARYNRIRCAPPAVLHAQMLALVDATAAGARRREANQMTSLLSLLWFQTTANCSVF